MCYGHILKFTLFPPWEQYIIYVMRVIAKRTLREFWASHPDSEQPLKAWNQEAGRADWSNPAEVRAQYGNASFVGDRVVFNIAGNKYRLVVWVNYPYRVVCICFTGSHAEYDKIDVRTVRT